MIWMEVNDMDVKCDKHEDHMLYNKFGVNIDSGNLFGDYESK